MKGEKRHEGIAYRPNDRRIGYLIRNSIYNLQDVIVLKEWLDHEHTMIIEWRLVCCLNFYRLL